MKRPTCNCYPKNGTGVLILRSWVQVATRQTCRLPISAEKAPDGRFLVDLKDHENPFEFYESPVTLPLNGCPCCLKPYEEVPE